jgi:hypothetical protein
MKSQGINVVDVTPTQKEEWEEELRYLMTEEVNWDALKDLIRSQISLAEARGRLSTITAFVEWVGKYMTETTKYYGTDKHGINPDDLLSFASYLKSNAPKV